MEPPIVLLVTSSSCGHCINLRGRDGIPSDDKPYWNNTYITSLLKFPKKKKDNQKACALIELHTESLDPTDNNIVEINIYNMIPSDDEIKNNYELFLDHRQITVGSDLERISIKRGFSNIININVYINGEYSKSLTDHYINKYIWSLADQEINKIRSLLKQGCNIKKYKSKILKEIEEITKDGSEITLETFERYILENYYNFNWLCSRLIPKTVRKYENRYPLWLLISSSEWRKSILNQERNIFAIMPGFRTFRDQKSEEYKTTPYSKKEISENISNILIKYYNNELELSSKEQVLFSWQKEIMN